MPKDLKPKYLRKILNKKSLRFKDTTEITEKIQFLGQKRASDAIEFGIHIKSRGYNLFAMGPPGIGKRTLVKLLLKRFALTQPVPSDWVYVYNFDSPEKPIPIELPSGLGEVLQKDMDALISEILLSVLTVFESDEYRYEQQAIKEDFNKKRKLYNAGTKTGEKTKIPHLYRERHEKEKELQTRYTLFVVKPSIDRLKEKYAEIKKIPTYLNACEKDIVVHVSELIKIDEHSGLFTFDLDNPFLTRYKINLLVNNRKQKGAPVIFLENPTYSNLICRVEYKSLFGNQVTDFTLIRSGALHRANHGFLIIEARKIYENKEAWESLKSALYSHKIEIQPIEHFNDTTQPISLKPISIPLDIKIILIGERRIYYRLCRRDSDFNELFKVAVDFDEQLPRVTKNIRDYATLMATFINKKKLLPFDASAIAAVIDHASRIAEDQDKLSTHILRIYDLLQEADYWARKHHKSIVDADDVKNAIAFQIERLDRSKELYYEEIQRHFVLINTSGFAIGELNCLSVVHVGKYAYGHPTRVTAKVRSGKGNLIDIHREIKLAGPIHSKAGLTIANFLADRYSRERLFSMTASIAFEQIYGELEGDSASVAELCALISALAQVPLNQSLAATGSINQYGEVQSIGGINEKIEGYFDICFARGLTGKQGVIMPHVNQKNLMLKEEILEAVAKKKFTIYTIQHVDEAIALLTGLKAGKRNRQGQFPKGTINALVEEQLRIFTLYRLKARE